MFTVYCIHKLYTIFKIYKQVSNTKYTSETGKTINKETTKHNRNINVMECSLPNNKTKIMLFPSSFGCHILPRKLYTQIPFSANWGSELIYIGYLAQYHLRIHFMLCSNETIRKFA